MDRRNSNHRRGFLFWLASDCIFNENSFVIDRTDRSYDHPSTLWFVVDCRWCRIHDGIHEYLIHWWIMHSEDLSIHKAGNWTSLRQSIQINISNWRQMSSIRKRSDLRVFECTSEPMLDICSYFIYNIKNICVWF